MPTDVTAASPAGLASSAALATGAFTSDGNPTSIVIGFNVRYIEVVNLTDNIAWEKQQGFPVNTTLKSVTGAQTIDATSAILFPADAGLNEPGSSVLLSVALCGTGKLISLGSIRIMYSEGGCVRIERVTNGYTISMRDPAIVKKNAARSTKGNYDIPYIDPDKQYVFKDIDDVLAFLKTNLDKALPTGDYASSFDDLASEDDGD